MANDITAGKGADYYKASLKHRYSTFSAADYLNSEELVSEYIRAAAERDDARVLMSAIAEVAKARGISQVAKDAGLGRESMYKTLSAGAHPRFETVMAIMKAMNLRLTVEPIDAGTSVEGNNA